LLNVKLVGASRNQQVSKSYGRMNDSVWLVLLERPQSRHESYLDENPSKVFPNSAS